MTFQEALTSYMARLGCTGKELAAASGIAPSIISRYRTGVHTPDVNGEQWRKLAEGLAVLAAERGIDELTLPGIEAALREALSTEAERSEQDRGVFHQNLNGLLSVFVVGNTELAQFLSFDRSHVVRIRAGERTPRDLASFSMNVGRFMAMRCRSGEERDRLASLVGADLSPDAGEEEYARAVARYLMPNIEPSDEGSIDTFLRKMDEFDLDEYIRVIHFDKMKTPTAPIQLPSSHIYTGLKELMEAQLDFLKTTVLSRSDGEVTMYSDLPMTEMSQDAQFPKKWMFGMAAMLKKGLRLNMIHNVDRPFYEMMLGLESYIPMYMTGQIAPYYLDGAQDSPFRHMLWVSGSAALQGECIVGHVRDGSMYLTSRKNELARCRKQAAQLLQRAETLMEIYGQDRRAAFERFLREDKGEAGARRSILSSLPLCTLSDGLARRILERSGVPDGDRAAILRHIRAERERVEGILTHSPVTDVLPEVEKDEYESYPIGLFLAGMFYPGDIRLTYEEYQEYMELCDAWAATHPGYACTRDKNAPFRNIQITILENKRVIVSKSKSPTIHFVIRHPKLIDAIENMVMPVVD